MPKVLPLASPISSSFFAPIVPYLVIGLILAGQLAAQSPQPAGGRPDARGVALSDRFAKRIQPLLKKYCVRCHNGETMESGIRLDQLDGKLADRYVRLWQGIAHQVSDEAMPPEDEPQPTAAERKVLADWIAAGVRFAKTRKRAKNGSIRRLTVAQYRNTLRDLLGIEDDLTDVLPADGVSKDGFLNNGQTMQLSPLLIEAYFEIAEEALERCVVDVDARPVIQRFRMDLGRAINRTPCPDKLILGANSLLLANEDFQVVQVPLDKPFPSEPFPMRTKYRFIEGYQGNATVRGWREYDSIYHAVFACMRGTTGYPKGLAYETVPEGLLLRPAIPSAELFQIESTYGPKANFKVSLRELPDRGRFRVTVHAARYDDGLLIDRGRRLPKSEATFSVDEPEQSQTVDVPAAGIYQVAVNLRPRDAVKPDASRLQEKLLGWWQLDGDAEATGGDGNRPDLAGKLTGRAKFVDSPFGKAVLLDGAESAVIVPRNEHLKVGNGEFTVAAWIHPRGLRQGGIVSLGGYGYTHGWLLDMPNGKGVLRIETARAGNFANGTVTSPPGVIGNNRWQHVAAVVRRGENKTRLYVNGYEVAVGTINDADLDNPTSRLHIGRVQDANRFKGEIDDVRVYGRALEVAELRALVQPGRRFVKAPRSKPERLTLELGQRVFSGTLYQPEFLVVRLPAGPLAVRAAHAGPAMVGHIGFTRLASDHELHAEFERFEGRVPRLGVHVGLRRDCGSTLTAVQRPQRVSATRSKAFIFEGAIGNFPSPDVEKDNVNYLAGIREIGVRSEYTDGRDMPRLLIRSVEFEGPFYEQWPPATHRRIFIDSDKPADSEGYAREIIRSFAGRAFRRPVTDREEQALIAVWRRSMTAGEDFQQSIKDTLLVVLTSPQFLFLIEDSASPAGEPLNDYELASKLSYFLWNTAPDGQLLRLAAAGQLNKSLGGELNRMVADPKFHQFTHEFVSQWLSLDKLDVVELDRKRFPTLTRDTKTQLRDEPVYFVEHLIRRNLPVKTLVESDFVLANEVVAAYYDLEKNPDTGFRFEPIKHRQAGLGGLLSQAGILAGLSNGREANPVKRGAWLARKIIAEPPDDPPPNVPALPEDDDEELSLREKLVRHRSQPGCAKCHAGIDPWGLPLEQFDAGGLFIHDRKVAGHAVLPDKTQVADARALKAYLANERVDQVAFSFLKHVATYATGRTLSYNELELLKAKGLELKPAGYRMRDLVRLVVESELFLEK